MANLGVANLGWQTEAGQQRMANISDSKADDLANFKNSSNFVQKQIRTNFTRVFIGQTYVGVALVRMSLDAVGCR